MSKAAVDAEFRADSLAACRHDPTTFISDWCWTYDPRRTPSTLPFDLWARQAEFIRWLQEREKTCTDGLAEKSRDSGLSYVCCAYALHGWLFRTGFSAGFGSRKLDFVDRRGDPDSLLEKIRIMLDLLPPWLKPAGFKPGEHDGYCKLVNPATGGTITGEGGDNIGRGGRKTIYFLDEAAFIEHPELVERSLSQTTRCRIDISTPNGPGNPFYTKRFGGNVAVFTFHWRDDPRKGQAWYDAECKRIGDPVTIAQEIDIDYTASVEGICIPAAWVRAAVGPDLPESGKTVCGFDVGEEGPDSSVVIPRRGPVVKDPVSWRGALTTESAWRARDEAQKMGASAVNYDCVGVGTGIKGTWGTAEKGLPFVVNAVNVGETPSDRTHWPDGKTSREKFLNLKAELWWKLRTRFEKTFEHVTKGVSHPPEDMISIPNHPQLISELSLLRYHRTETGKIQMESKAQLRARGVKSPDYADALVLAFACEAVEWEPTPLDPRESLIGQLPRDVQYDYNPDEDDDERRW